jgi:hypothetical protein
VTEPAAGQLTGRSIAEGELQLDRPGYDHAPMIAN